MQIIQLYRSKSSGCDKPQSIRRCILFQALFFYQEFLCETQYQVPQSLVSMNNASLDEKSNQEINNCVQISSLISTNKLDICHKLIKTGKHGGYHIKCYSPLLFLKPLATCSYLLNVMSNWSRWWLWFWSRDTTRITNVGQHLKKTHTDPPIFCNNPIGKRTPIFAYIKLFFVTSLWIDITRTIKTDLEL